MTNEKNLIRKTVNFNDDEKYLYDFAEQMASEEGVKFATWVKRLIKKEMDQESLEDKIDRRIEEYLKNKNLVAAEEEETTATKYTKDDKNALLGFMSKQ